jgi:hypothetical protein
VKKKKPTVGESMIAGAKQALAFARGEKEHGCIVHTPEMMKECSSTLLRILRSLKRTNNFRV